MQNSPFEPVHFSNVFSWLTVCSSHMMKSNHCADSTKLYLSELYLSYNSHVFYHE